MIRISLGNAFCAVVAFVRSPLVGSELVSRHGSCLARRNEEPPWPDCCPFRCVNVPKIPNVVEMVKNMKHFGDKAKSMSIPECSKCFLFATDFITKNLFDIFNYLCILYSKFSTYRIHYSQFTIKLSSSGSTGDSTLLAKLASLKHIWLLANKPNKCYLIK